MLTIDQYRQLWQLLACLVSDVDLEGIQKTIMFEYIVALMAYCKKVLEEN